MDRRWYKRVDVGIPCVLYINQQEYSGVIMNICEDGIAIEFGEDFDDKALDAAVKNTESVKFVGFDTFAPFGVIQTSYINGSAKIVRHDDGTKVVGCEIVSPSEALTNYILDKKTALFLKSWRLLD